MSLSTTTHLEAEAALLSLGNISKQYGDFSALDRVDLTLYAGRTHCLLGENGAGKSTLCKIIYGETAASNGTLQFQSEDYAPHSPADALKIGIAMVHQHFSLILNMRVYENLMLGNISGILNTGKFVDRVKALSDRYHLDIEPYKRIDELSVGQQQRVEILKCLMRDPRLLILDEPTAVLLPDEIDSLLDICEQIVAENRSILLVTHKLAEIARVADEVTVLRGGRRVKHSDFSPDQVDSLVGAMFGKDLREADLQLMQTPNADNLSTEDREPDAHSHPSMILDGLGFTDDKGKVCLSDITMVINSGEIHGLAGVEGNGQSELGDLLAGLYPPTRGRFYIHNTELTQATPSQITAAGVGVVPEDRLRVGCIEDMTLAENLLLPALSKYRSYGLLDRNAIRNAALDLMRRFDVRAESPDMPFKSLSGGNQQKAVLARELTIEPLHFLLAAHPTRGLDIGAVFDVYKHIRQAAEQGAGVLLISSELDDLIETCDKISVIYRGRIVGTLPADPSSHDQIGAWMAGTGLSTS